MGRRGGKIKEHGKAFLLDIEEQVWGSPVFHKGAEGMQGCTKDVITLDRGLEPNSVRGFFPAVRLKYQAILLRFAEKTK